MKASRFYISVAAVLVLGSTLQGCSQSTGIKSAGRSNNPDLKCDTMLYDEQKGTFCVTVLADSVEGAQLAFQLLDGDSVLSQSSDGRFAGIAPCKEGYDVKMEAQWPDTTIVRRIRVFPVAPVPPVDPLSKEQLAQLINSRDKTLIDGSNKYIAHDVEVSVKGSQLVKGRSSLQDVVMRLENNEWAEVIVDNMTHDEATKLVKTVVLRPQGEKIPQPDPDTEDLEF